MPAPHNHAAWQVDKDAKLARWKESKGKGGAAKRKAPTEKTAATKKGTLRLKNTFKSALTTKMFVSDAEVEDFVDTLMDEIAEDESEGEATSDDESKE